MCGVWVVSGKRVGPWGVDWKGMKRLQVLPAIGSAVVAKWQKVFVQLQHDTPWSSGAVQSACMMLRATDAS